MVYNMNADVYVLDKAEIMLLIDWSLEYAPLPKDVMIGLCHVDSFSWPLKKCIYSANLDILRILLNMTLEKQRQQNARVAVVLHRMIVYKVCFYIRVTI